MMETPAFKPISDRIAKIGESPVWSEAEQALYWIDCNAPALYRLDFVTGRESAWSMPCRIGGVVPSASGPIVILQTGVFAFDKHRGTLEQIAATPLEQDHLALHEARCDGAGRLWVGVINLDYIHGQARGGAELFVLRRGRLERCEAAAGGTVSNGMAWSPDYRTLYYADTADRTIYAFDFDVERGAAGHRRTFYALPPDMGLPDGAAVDVEGGYWFACPGGGRVRRLNPDGSVDRDILTPCDCPTKISFGSARMDHMFVTSHSLRPAAAGKADLEGRLFMATTPIAGMPEPQFDPNH